MSSFPMAPLFRQSVGFDRFNDLFESALRNDTGSSYPPYNIEKHGDDQYRIVVAAAGQAEMIKGDWIKPGATVIDVGTSRIVHDGRKTLVGDVEFASACGVAGAITPVPGGVGPMTIMCLMHNTLLAACRRKALAEPRLW